MSHQNYGNTKSYTELLKDFEKTLNRYASDIGTDKIIYNTEVEQVLLMDFKQLKNLDKTGMEEFAYLLAQYAAVLTKETNRNTAILKWAEDKLNKLISHNYDKYVGDKMMKYEIVKYMIVNNDSAATQLNEIIKDAESRLTELQDMSSKIYYMSTLLRDLGRNR